MARLVLDTNIFISALGWGGRPGKVLKSCISGRHELLLSLELLEELASVLRHPKFDFIPVEKKVHLLKNLAIISEIVRPAIKLNVIPEDPADNKVLECAVAGAADYIISGDAHLLDLKQYSKVRIISAEEFVI